MRKQPVALALLAFLITGCPKKPIDSIQRPADPLPIVMAAIDSGAELAYLSGNLAEDKLDLVGCIVGHSFAAALTTVGEGLRGNLTGGAIPSIDYDISSCLGILTHGEGDPPQGAEVPDMVEPVATMLLSSVKTVILGYGSQMKCEDRAWAVSGLEYAQGAVPAIVSEIEAPDGSIAIPGVTVDLEACEED